MKRKSKKKQKWEKKLDKILDQGISESTRKTYQRDLDYFWAWVRVAIGRRRRRYPVSEKILEQFVAEHLTGLDDRTMAGLARHGFKKRKPKLSPDTVKGILLAISVAHKEAGKASPTGSPRLKHIMSRARKALGDRPRNRKEPITVDILNQLLETCDDSLRGIRDRAILLVGFYSGGRRGIEIVDFVYEGLRKVDDGYIVRMMQSKNNRSGDEVQEVPVLGNAAAALSEWLMRSGIRSGKLFRGIRNDDTLNDGYSTRRMRDMLQKRIKQIGLDPRRFGNHSLRSGFVTEAGRSGVGLIDVMQLSKHKDVMTAALYYREGEMLRNPAAHLGEKLNSKK